MANVITSSIPKAGYLEWCGHPFTLEPDPKGGWKGRTMWASYSEAMNHQEGNLSSHIATFQIRPNPLAH